MKSQTDSNLIKCKNHNKVAYQIISFHTGLSSLSDLGVSFFFKDEIKLQPAELSQVMCVILIPWIVKPFFGLLTDLCPIFGYRRKYYLIICGLICIFSFQMLVWKVSSTFEAILCLFCIHCGISFSTVLGEAIVVELSQIDSKSPSKAKDNVSMFFFTKHLGNLLSAYFKGLFVEIMTIRHLFLVSSFVPFLLVISGCILIENRIENRIENFPSYQTIPEKSNGEAIKKKSLLSQFFSFISQKTVLVPMMYLILFMSVPSFYDPFFYFLTEQLKFSGSDFGKISFCTTITTLITIMIYKYYLKNCRFKLMISISTLIAFFFTLFSYLIVIRFNVAIGIPDFWFLLIANLFLSVLGELILMPMFSLACLISPKNLEGTVYSIFMSALHIGERLSRLFGAILTYLFGITNKDYHNLKNFILVSDILSLFPVLVLLFISDSYFQPNEKIILSSVELSVDDKIVIETEKELHVQDISAEDITKEDDNKENA